MKVLNKIKTNIKKIFIADDDSAILDALKILLEDEGYEVETSLNGEELKTMTENLPDIILLDVWMSGVNGEHVCMNIKSKELTKNIPVVMISANKGTKKVAERCGADDFIDKPFQMQDLLKLLKTHI